MCSREDGTGFLSPEHVLIAKAGLDCRSNGISEMQRLVIARELLKGSGDAV
jgi:hypothetical protein